jgi:proteasome lid subunit RPN8/RPN11
MGRRNKRRRQGYSGPTQMGFGAMIPAASSEPDGYFEMQGGFLDDEPKEKPQGTPRSSSTSAASEDSHESFEEWQRRIRGLASGDADPDDFTTSRTDYYQRASGVYVAGPSGYSYSPQTYGKKLEDLKIVFSPYAWHKLRFMRDAGPTEVAGHLLFDAEHSFRVEDFMMLPQRCTSATFEFADKPRIEFGESMLQKGISGKRWANFVAHTHPGSSATPSSVDETNFRDKYSDGEISIMFILARGGEVTCRVKFNVGPAYWIDIAYDAGEGWTGPFPASDEKAWKEEYDRCVSQPTYHYNQRAGYSPSANNNAPTGYPGWRQEVTRFPASGSSVSVNVGTTPNTTTTDTPRRRHARLLGVPDLQDAYQRFLFADAL